MKTKNNIQKTALKSVAAATGLAILSLTVNAQGVLKSFFENDGTGQFAMVIENANNKSFAANTFSGSFTSAETFAVYLEAENELPLNLEEWMTDDRNLGSISALLETEAESEMVVENWMMNENILISNEQKPKLTKKSLSQFQPQPIFTARLISKKNLRLKVGC